MDKEDIAKFILEQYPSCIAATDNEGRRPLHYAALLKDDGKMMRFLMENGADESALDNVIQYNKICNYYKYKSYFRNKKQLLITEREHQK